MFQIVKAKDEEALANMILDRCDSTVDSRTLAMDLLYPLPKRSKRFCSKTEDEKEVSMNLLAMAIGHNTIPVHIVEDPSFQRWVHSLDPEVNNFRIKC